jgi:predicted ferric reductase
MKNRILARTGWPFLLLLIGVPIIIWALMVPLSDRFSTIYTSLSSVGRLSGIVAAVLFCLNIILTSRLKVLELLFGGLNKMYIAHHIIGGTALLVLLIHPLVFALRATTISARDGAMQMLPFVNDWATTFGILALWLFIVLMVLTFYVKLPYRIWLFTHKFLGLVLLGIVLHVLLGSNDVANSVALRLYCWSLLGAASMAFIYRTILPRLFVRRYKYQIAEVFAPTKDTVRIVMRPMGRQLKFDSGQFIFVSFRIYGFSHEWHPFSISSNSAADGLAITVKSLGKYTSTLISFAANMVGRDVWVEGAYGDFSFQHVKIKKQIWIAGGIGITPFLSMIPDVDPGHRVDLYYSVKTVEEVIDWPFLQEIATKSNGAVRVIPVVTDRDGFLTAKRISTVSGDLHQQDILMCGPPPMMHALHDQFSALGVRKKQIHSEEFAMS